MPLLGTHDSGPCGPPSPDDTSCEPIRRLAGRTGDRGPQRLLREYVDYYNADRVHMLLRDSPMGRPTESRRSPDAQIVGLPRVGGLHHRYAVARSGMISEIQLPVRRIGPAAEN